MPMARKSSVFRAVRSGETGYSLCECRVGNENTLGIDSHFRRVVPCSPDGSTQGHLPQCHCLDSEGVTGGNQGPTSRSGRGVRRGHDQAD